MMTGNQARAHSLLTAAAPRATLAGCTVNELATLPIARAVAELNAVIEEYKAENRALRERLREMGAAP